MRSAYLYILAFLCINAISGPCTYCQVADTSSFKINSRHSFCNPGEKSEMLLHVPEIFSRNIINVTLFVGEAEAGSCSGRPVRKILRIPFTTGPSTGSVKVRAIIRPGSGTSKSYEAYSHLLILRHKQNEVRTDRLTGGMIINRKQFFPFGFYCYSPVHPTLPEEEVVNGFNMISPYQKIMPETFGERKAYMDRCAQLGMKVHYNLLSVSGGGGVGSKIEGLTAEMKKERLINEIKSFMDHPALLAWYISDEPTGNKITPEELEVIYRTVRETDPWHPVSIVFMAPFLSSRKYINALDIVMADPYPIPDLPPTMVGKVTGQLRTEFEGKRPVWIVPQAFGGGELWEREPTVQEIRLMTYLSVVNGARGIQYFVRQGPNAFPKSTVTWNECGRMALEIAGIAPWLLSEEEAPTVRVTPAAVQVLPALHNGKIIIVAVNTTNAPIRADISIAGIQGGDARVIYGNRSIKISGGTIVDHLPAYGSEVYLVTKNEVPDTIRPYRGNLLKDPGFEDISSPGVPSACYAWNGADRGSTFFLDPSEHVEGNHSLRMVTPVKERGARLRFFPVRLNAGRTYILSVWAKADPVYESVVKEEGDSFEGNDGAESYPEFEIALGDFGKKRFVPGGEWQQFVTSVTIPVNGKLPARTNVVLRMPGAGRGWFDMLHLFEAVDIRRSINPELQVF